MTDFPQHFIWRNAAFVEIPPPPATDILVADSWRVQNGKVWGLADHLQRFFTGLKAQAQAQPGAELQNVVIGDLEQALQQKLFALSQDHPGIEFFPRISMEPHQASWRIVLLIRPAPSPRSTTSLWIPTYTDPRTRPTVKGPDISLLRQLVAKAPTDDVVLHDGTNVHETTTGALLVWQSSAQLVLCQASQQLASISAQRIADYARSHNISVTTRPVTIQELAAGESPVWFANTLHGISPVTTIGGVPGETRVVAHPTAAQWQAAWWRKFTV